MDGRAKKIFGVAVLESSRNLYEEGGVEDGLQKCHFGVDGCGGGGRGLRVVVVDVVEGILCCFGFGGRLGFCCMCLYSTSGSISTSVNSGFGFFARGRAQRVVGGGVRIVLVVVVGRGRKSEACLGVGAGTARFGLTVKLLL